MFVCVLVAPHVNRFAVRAVSSTAQFLSTAILSVTVGHFLPTPPILPSASPPIPMIVLVAETGLIIVVIALNEVIGLFSCDPGRRQFSRPVGPAA